MTERPRCDADIVTVGFGPAAAAFLTTLSHAELAEPPLVLCYERADDISFGVSGIATRARAIRQSLPDLSQVPMATPIREERLAYLLDPTRASRRSRTLRTADNILRAAGCADLESFELPYIPSFLSKHGGLLMSMGQFNAWTGAHIMGSGLAQIWPGTPVAEAIVEDGAVHGVRLLDQGVDRAGVPDASYMPGMEVRAQLTVVADGPVGAVGRQLDDQLGLPPGHIKSEWAVGSKMLIELPENTTLEPGTVVHTFGYPEPEIFGFFYVYADRLASAGIFIPSWFANPVRTSYRYLQHFLLHPYIWRYVEGGTLRSWGAKSIQESGRRGEPHLVGDGYARIGEGSGSTNVLTGSGVDEAWATGVQLAEAVIELAKAGKPYTKENLEATYVRRRRASWLERESRIAERARDGFHHGVVTGLIGMGLAGMTKGKLGLSPAVRPMPDVYEFFSDRIPAEEIARIRASCSEKGVPLHDALMDRAGWPAISYDGRLLISQQDALLVGGKVQAAPGYADHVVFLDEEVCRACGRQLCAEICSGEAIRPGSEGAPVFDREKCVHCGACFWNCPDGNLVFKAGAGGLHSAEN